MGTPKGSGKFVDIDEETIARRAWVIRTLSLEEKRLARKSDRGEKVDSPDYTPPPSMRELNPVPRAILGLR